MAKYKEVWDNITDQNIIGYIDTETNSHIPIEQSNPHYQAVLAWLQVNTADPQYTQEEIEAIHTEEKQRQAENYLSETSSLVQTYRDAIARGILPPIPAPKYNKIINQRRRAARLIKKTISKFTIS